ncbi:MULTISPECIES: ATP-binding protein [Halobacteriovorax]|uniref:histidine kinase n=1 Tax=Halobacteriovorax vibrionivorans TaxID=2152716 RepID=A0ABY0IJ48_9BACT|nr:MULTISPECIES: ATP-binding protein [Halobacteriovorax]RZF22994.1 CHASE2 domain-containing protein [Halobacteriovorax vibrionivorans]TGD46863.1 CHASE2 domain-containing protein [Halobacteriovorax sp. Y22]
MKKVFKFFKDLDYTKYYPALFTIVFLLVLFQYKFPTIEAIFYDLRLKTDFSLNKDDRIVLIKIDEESDEFLGESYPYTYTTYLKLFRKVLKDKPAIINFFGDLSAPLNEREANSLELLHDEIKAYVKQGGLYRYGTELDAWGERLPPQQLRDLGYSPAIVNIDSKLFAKDDVVRRMVLNISGEETLSFWTANEWRILHGKEPLILNNLKSAYYMPEADASFSLFRYPLRKLKHVEKLPVHRVVVGNIPPGYFNGKIVLIGPAYISNLGHYAKTPFDKDQRRSPKLEIHANMTKSLIENKLVYAIPMWVTKLISMLIGIILSIVISRIQPVKGLVTTVAIIFSTILISYLIFIAFGLWLYITHILLTVFVVYYIWVPFRAIGEYQRRYKIQEETKLLKRVEDLKQNFISLMSHDLKTPVAKIAGVADNMLQKNRGGETYVHEGLKTIIDSTKELNNFITSILDLTKVESRNISLNLQSKDVNKVIDDCVNSLSYLARSKEMKINTELGPLFPIEIDTSLVNRIISNIVENSIKYAGIGKVIDIKTWDDDTWVYIEISDNGVGMGQNDVDNIFEKFYRVKNDASHTIKGSGLGLYLVKYFVELHGGEISVTSQIGEGTSFLIKFLNK